MLNVNIQQQFILHKILKQLENDYDYCIIDCPPALNIITINALVASDNVIVPIKIDKYALDGLEYLLDSIEGVREELNPNLQFKGCFITMDTNTVINKEVKDALSDLLDNLIFNTTIRQNVSVTESSFLQKPVVYYKKKCNASSDYRKLVKEMF